MGGAAGAASVAEAGAAVVVFSGAVAGDAAVVSASLVLRKVKVGARMEGGATV